MNNAWKNTACLSIFFIFILQASGQTEAPIQKITLPSPEVSTIQRYGEYGSSGYTGKVDINIPVYEVKSNQLSLPITLRYVSNGKKTVRDRSCVGYGWMLDAGGLVSRVIYGMPDLDVPWDYSLRPADQYNFKADYDTLAMLCGIGGGYMDSEYDIFSYSFGSHSGRFIVDQKKDSRSFILLRQEPVKIEYDTNYYFSLYDESGTQYIFGDNGSMERMNAANNKLTTTAWYPTSIISADKKDTITLKYKTASETDTQYFIEYVIEDNYKGYYNKRTVFDSDKSGWKEYNYTSCRISEINYKGGKVKFNYSTTNKYKLESIEVSDGKGTIIKKILLESNLKGDPSKGGAYYLEKLTMHGEGTSGQDEVYQFDYYTPFEFDTRNSDWWGYANKLTESVLMNIPLTTCTLINYLNDNSYLTFGVPNAKDANRSAMLCGMLKTITYPTGGKTTFEYESNQFSNYGIAVTGNGLRVAKVANDDGAGNTNIKTYQYGDNGLGYYPNMPKLEYYSRLFYFAYTDYYCTDFADPFDCYGSFRQRRYNIGPDSNVSEELSRPVQYETVTEYLGDTTNNTGKTEYKYSKVSGGVITRSQWYDSFPEDSYMIQDNDIWHYQVATLNDYAEGCLLEKVISKKENGVYKEVYKIVNSYDFINTVTKNGMRVVNLIVADAGSSSKTFASPTECLAKFYDLPVFLYSDYSITAGACVLYKTEEYVDGVMKLTENTYNANYLPKTVSQTDSKNRKVTTSYTYSTDIDNVQGSIFNDMSKNNMTGIPVETSTTVNRSGVNYITNATINLYKNFSGAIKPEKEYSLSLSEPVTNYQPLTANTTMDSRMDLEVTYEKYDAGGNILQLTTRDKVTTTYLWGYNHLYPIAEIKGATYSDVTGKIMEATLNSIAAKSELNSTDSTTINSLRAQLPNALVTTYTYKPLVGMSSMTDPKGIVTKYDYDASGRLNKVTQSDKAIESYEYHYKN